MPDTTRHPTKSSTRFHNHFSCPWVRPQVTDTPNFHTTITFCAPCSRHGQEHPNLILLCPRVLATTVSCCWDAATPPLQSQHRSSRAPTLFSFFFGRQRRHPDILELPPSPQPPPTRFPPLAASSNPQILSGRAMPPAPVTAVECLTAPFLCQ